MYSEDSVAHQLKVSCGLGDYLVHVDWVIPQESTPSVLKLITYFSYSKWSYCDATSWLACMTNVTVYWVYCILNYKSCRSRSEDFEANKRRRRRIESKMDFVFSETVLQLGMTWSQWCRSGGCEKPDQWTSTKLITFFHTRQYTLLNLLISGGYYWIIVVGECALQVAVLCLFVFKLLMIINFKY